MAAQKHHKGQRRFAKPTPKLAAPKIAATYLLGSLLWAWCSDAAVGSVNLPKEVVSELQIYYAVGFLSLSALLIYLIVGAYARRLNRLMEERTKASLELAHRLALAIELRDQCTSGHNHRLGMYSRILAEEMGLAPEDCALIYHAAALHDIGKIGVPDRILNKPGPLSKEERKVIQQHVELGASLLASGKDPLMKLAHEIAMTHHEAWDGSGYPAGLEGEAIPLSGRIVAVCDMYDALMSARPYKDAWQHGDAVKEILRLKGQRFDPEVIDAFERVLPKLEEASKVEQPAPWSAVEQRMHPHEKVSVDVVS